MTFWSAAARRRFWLRKTGAVARPSGRASLPLTSMNWRVIGPGALPNGRATAPLTILAADKRGLHESAKMLLSRFFLISDLIRVCPRKSAANFNPPQSKHGVNAVIVCQPTKC